MMTEENKEYCPDCGKELVKSYHHVFKAPVWWVCNQCEKYIKETGEMGAYHPTREELLYPPGAPEIKEYGHIAVENDT